MAASDPDFLSLLDETSRLFQSSASPSNDAATASISVRDQERQRQNNAAFWNETITLRLVPPPLLLAEAESSNNDDDCSSGTVLTISRFRLTADFLHDVVNRGSTTTKKKKTIVVSHLCEQNTKTVIEVKDVQMKCLQSPIVYDVIVHFAGGVELGGVLSSLSSSSNNVVDSYYKGDVIFRITNVPPLSKNGLFAVSSVDVQRWIVNGAIDGVESVQILSTNVIELEDNLKKLDFDINNVFVKPIYNELGRAIVGQQLTDARIFRLQALQDERVQTERRLVEVEQMLALEREKHYAACPVLVTQYDDCDTTSTGKLSFTVKLEGKKREFYVDLINSKTDWCSSLPLYATTEKPMDHKSLKQQKSINNNKSTKEVMTVIDKVELAEHEVDVGTVSIIMLPDGFGVHELFITTNSATESSNSEDGLTARSLHRLFHGTFHEGSYHEGTMHSDCGVYTGTFQFNQPSGSGRMKYKDGSVLVGDFVVFPSIPSPSSSSELLLSNPYLRGLPHGENVTIQFKDGITSYVGEMNQGRVTGSGTYRLDPSDNDNDDRRDSSKNKKKIRDPNSLVVIKGQFTNGMFQTDNDDDNGYKLLSRQSFMFGGTRMWGPLSL
jgi:hypothetical protein